MRAEVIIDKFYEKVVHIIDKLFEEDMELYDLQQEIHKEIEEARDDMKARYS